MMDADGYGPLEIIRNALGTEGATVEVKLPLWRFNGMHIPAGESYTIETLAHIEITGPPL